MAFCSFDALMKSLKKKEKKKKDGNSRGFTTSQLPQKEIGMMKFLSLNSNLLARTTLALISSFAITGYFQKVNSQGCSLGILNFELSYAFLYELCELFQKQAVLCGNYSVSVIISDSLLCVTNHCIKVASKLILFSVSRFKFALFKGRVKLIYF